MLKAPLISVIMPVYNCEEYVGKAIESILNQTYKDFEFIIIDDGSTDLTDKIIKSYRDSRIKLITNKKNIGLVKNLNRGLKICRGKYLARMDADDIAVRNRFKIQYNFLEKNPDVGVLGSWIKTIGSGNGKIVRYPVDNENIRVKLLFDCVIAHPSVMIRLGVLRKNDLKYDTDAITAEDYELWTKTVLRTKMMNLNKVLLLYREHSGQKTKRETQMDKFKDNIRKNLLEEALGIREGFMTHNTICSKSFKYNNKYSIDLTAKWFKYLKERNEKLGYCSSEVFNKVLSDYFWGIAVSTKIKNTNLLRYFLKESRYMEVSTLKKLILIKKYIYEKR